MTLGALSNKDKMLEAGKQAIETDPYLGEEDSVDVGVVFEGMEDACTLRMAGGSIDERLVHTLCVFSQRPDVVAVNNRREQSYN